MTITFMLSFLGEQTAKKKNGYPNFQGKRNSFGQCSGFR